MTENLNQKRFGQIRILNKLHAGSCGFHVTPETWGVFSIENILIMSARNNLIKVYAASTVNE